MINTPHNSCSNYQLHVYSSFDTRHLLIVPVIRIRLPKKLHVSYFCGSTMYVMKSFYLVFICELNKFY